VNYWLGTGSIFGAVLAWTRTPPRIACVFFATLVVGYLIIHPADLLDLLAVSLLVVIFDWIFLLLLMVLAVAGDRFAQLIIPKIFTVPDKLNALHQTTFLVLSVAGLPIGLVLFLLRAWRRF